MMKSQLANLNKGQNVIGRVEVAAFPNMPSVIIVANKGHDAPSVFTLNPASFGDEYSSVAALFLSADEVLPPAAPDANVVKTVGDLRRFTGGSSQSLDIWFEGTGRRLAVKFGTAELHIYDDAVPPDEVVLRTGIDVERALRGLPDSEVLTVVFQAIPCHLVYSPELGTNISFDAIRD